MLVFLGVYSAVMCTATSLELTFSRGACAIVMLTASILFYGLFTVLETFHNGKLYGILGITLFFAMIVFYFWGQVQRGLVVMVNGFLRGFMSFSGAKRTLLDLEVEEGVASIRFCTSFVLILLGVYLIVMVSAFFYRRRRPLVFLILTAPFVLLPLFVGRLGYFSNLFTYLIVAMAVIGTRHQKTDATDRRMRQKLSILLMGMGLIVGAVSFIYMPPERYEEKKDGITETKNTVVALMTWSTEDVLSWMKSHFTGDAIDYGQIGDEKEIVYTGETMLKISGTVNNLHGMYLKGYVGDLYEDNQWSSLRDDPDYLTELNSLELQGLSPENWHIKLYSSLGESSDGLKNLWTTGTIRIRNVAFGYGNYVVPYLPTAPFKTKENGRTAIEAPGIDYTVEYFLVYPYIVRDDLLVQAYPVGTNAYWNMSEIDRRKMTEFVKKYYLQVPDSVSEVCDGFKEYLNAGGGLYAKFQEGDVSQKEILKALKEYIMKDTEYTLAPGKTPENRDTVEYFLQESKKGYCTYYATAAVVLLRSVGIPARYVEGMYVSGAELREATEKNAEIPVPDSDAHAWIEVYDDRYGFVPMEVTPGKEEDGGEQAGNSSGNSQNKDDRQDDTDSPDEPVEEPELATPTPAVSQVPEESMIFDDIDGNEDPEEETGSDRGSDSSDRAWQIWIEIAIALVLVAAAIEAERRIRRYLFQSRLQRLRMKRKIRMIHHHLMPLFSARKAAYRGQSMDAYAAVIAEAMDMPVDPVREYVSIVYHARFGPDDITEAQFAEFRMLYDQIRRKAYEDAKILKKLYYMYIMVL